MRSLRAVVAIAVAVASLGWPGAAAAAGQSSVGSATTAGSTAAGPQQTKTVTLITGDRVRLSTVQGRPVVGVESEGKGYQLTTRDGDTYVVPVDALPHVQAGRLDEQLFNVTQLIAAGYDDRSRSSLPLILMPPVGETKPPAGVTPAVPANPPGAARRALLPSINAAAVTEDKARAREFWRGLTARLAQPGTLTRSGDVGRVFLDRKVRAALADSVPQIGAPQAWAAGYTGKGVTVAVLDTGYDPTHPDLAGRVAAAQDFTGEGSAVDTNGHGTHVAATVGGSARNPGGRLNGVAPETRLIIGRVLDGSGSGDLSWVIAGMEWAVAQGARVVNLSLGAGESDGTDPVSEAVDSLTVKSGTLFVVAAGNAGPGVASVQAPGAAAQALTVGAVDKAGQLAAFSGRGPRTGDAAVKPEVTAPGVGIIAARAAGTSAGELIDDKYTSLSGTSMATPHVAGAAALLAQQHPDWRAAQLKAALVNTAQPLAGPAIAMGTGRIDLAAAIRQPIVVSTGSIVLGHVDWTGSARSPRTSTVSYRNTSSRPITLDLTAAAAADGGKSAALSVSPARLTIAPTSTATATLRLDPDHTAGGVYTGQLVARTSGTALRVPVGFEVAGPTHKLTLSAVGRNGKPVGAFSQAQLWNLDTGDLMRGILGAEPATLDVPPGRYALMVFAFTVDDGDWPRELTVLGRPELTVTKDTTLSFDARQAVPITVQTPENAQVRDVTVAWQRVVGEKSIITGFGLNPRITTKFSATPTARVTSGTFEFTTHFELGEPPLTLATQKKEVTPAPVPNTPTLDGSRTLAITSEVAQARGKALLLKAPMGEPVDLSAAERAGAALVLLHSGDSSYYEPFTEGSTVPAYALQEEDVARLGRTLRVTGTPESPYSYQVLLPERGRIPANLTYDTRRLLMATVRSSFHGVRESQASEGRFAITPTALAAYSAFRVVPTPSERVDHLTVGSRDAQVTWRHEASADISSWYAQGTVTGLARTYQAGERTAEDWFGAVSRPAMPAVAAEYAFGAPANRSHDALRIAMPQWANGSGDQYGWLEGTDSALLTLKRDGVPLLSTSAANAQVTVPSGVAAYELGLDVRRDQPWWTTSTATSSKWTFRSGRPDGIAVLPLLQAAYSVGTDLRNTVHARHAYPLVIRPGYQPGVTLRGRLDVRVAISSDDGHTWHTLTGRRAADGTVTLLVPAVEGFTSVQVTITDQAGNQLDQTITRAWAVTLH
ncbi:subtilisin family serine protease [Hamadaea flava]|uniref:S8 family peptidase n=1 Tax=Hamadaea flava TaxID=1742688 RepID=A0ABV8LM72_9ACTN|nr:S8 family peptidase [Hamadaea flava]MCP2323842.1 subtilisin family serine protease [Hamadaea flava]